MVTYFRNLDGDEAVRNIRPENERDGRRGPEKTDTEERTGFVEQGDRTDPSGDCLLRPTREA